MFPPAKNGLTNNAQITTVKPCPRDFRHVDTSAKRGLLVLKYHGSEI